MLIRAMAGLGIGFVLAGVAAVLFPDVYVNGVHPAALLFIVGPAVGVWTASESFQSAAFFVEGVADSVVGFADRASGGGR